MGKRSKVVRIPLGDNGEYLSWVVMPPGARLDGAPFPVLPVHKAVAIVPKGSYSTSQINWLEWPMAGRGQKTDENEEKWFPVARFSHE